MRRPRLTWFVWLGGVLAATVAMFYAAAYAFIDRDAFMVYKRDMVDLKLARLQAPSRPPHVIFVSGSNALYSLDSPHLERLIGRPVTNAAVHWGLTFYMAERAAGNIRRGDLMVMPLEYNLYPLANGGMLDPEACYVIAHSRDTLRTAGDLLEAFRKCPARWLAYGLVLRGARAAGRSLENAKVGDRMDGYGDIVINTPERAPKGRRYGSRIPSGLEQREIALKRLKPVIDETRRRGGRFAISFPVSPESDALNKEGLEIWLANLRRWAERNGVLVISHPTRHMFENSCFFDSAYHLHRGCTQRNAQAYADAIRELGF